MGIFETLQFAYPELLLTIGSMALLITGVFLGDGSTRQISIASVILLVFAAVLVLFAAPAPTASLFDDAFQIDAFSSFAKVVIFLAAAFAIWMSDGNMSREQSGRFEFPILVVLAAFGMALMVSASDLIALYMGVEMQSLALYVLAAFNRDSRRSTEAGLKYFVLGALSSCLLLYGASLIYGFSGATSFAAIAEAAKEADNNAGLVIGLVFLISGLAFKVSAAPFHMWTPDVYEGAPTPVTAFFAAAPKLAGMALFTRTLVVSFPAAIDDWRPVIAIIAIASMAIGAFSAIPQTNIKRLMAYSSIGHMGYALIGLAAGTSEGARAILVYMTIYVVMTIGTFACILMMRRRGGMTEGISDLSGLSRTNMPMTLILTVLFFSLAGVPPTAGFFGKWFVFFSAVDEGMVWLAVAGVIASAISAFYYLRIVWFMWFDEPAPVFERDATPALRVAAWGSALLMFPLLTVFISPLLQAAGRAAAALF